MQIEILEPHGLCTGVNAAIAEATRHRNAYCLHHLVHNEIVVDELKALGYRFVDDIEDVPDGETVVFSAHGVPPETRRRAAEKGLRVVDTTCPFVERAHRVARESSEAGMPVVVIGDRGHAEVKGIMGEIAAMREPREGDRIAVVCQTTLNADDVMAKVEELRRKYDVAAVAGVCTATKLRQDAVRNFDGDALLVLGSRESANTRRLCEVARRPVFLAGNMDEVRKAMEEMKGFEKIGVTSGASTPERFFERAVDCLSNAPRHVAIIMDGNGRWAKARGRPRGFGHAEGAKTLMRVVDWLGARGIRYATVYAFSTENWKRPKAEVEGLMRLFAATLRKHSRKLVESRVRLRVIGRRGDLPEKLLKTIEDVEKATERFERQLIVCFSYGGRAEIVDAANTAIARGEKVTEETFRQCLYAPDVPDPDLVIRTSGERRISNFLLWESAYAEYYFTDTLWPDFSEADLDAALADYSSRSRRKGGVQ